MPHPMPTYVLWKRSQSVNPCDAAISLIPRRNASRLFDRRAAAAVYVQTSSRYRWAMSPGVLPELCWELFAEAPAELTIGKYDDSEDPRDRMPPIHPASTQDTAVVTIRPRPMARMVENTVAMSLAHDGVRGVMARTMRDMAVKIPTLTSPEGQRKWEPVAGPGASRWTWARNVTDSWPIGALAIAVLRSP